MNQIMKSISKGYVNMKINFAKIESNHLKMYTVTDIDNVK